MKWVSVKERLPKPDSVILIVHVGTNKNTAFFGRIYVLPAYFTEDQLFYDTNIDHNLNNEYWEVTYWAPLPEPPQPDQSKLEEEENGA